MCIAIVVVLVWLYFYISFDNFEAYILFIFPNMLDFDSFYDIFHKVEDSSSTLIKLDNIKKKH